jgi:hypothetical protein
MARDGVGRIKVWICKNTRSAQAREGGECNRDLVGFQVLASEVAPVKRQRGRVTNKP